MPAQLTTDRDALRLFFTDDIYLVNEPAVLQARMETEIVDAAATLAEADHEGSSAAVTAPQLENFEYLGKNQKNILILVNDPVNKVSTEKGSELLRNIVKAIGLSANDFALVNYAQYARATYPQFKSFFACKMIFCFGVSASDLQVGEQSFNEIHTLGDARIIFCDNLELLSADQQGKKALWGSLKELNL